jgi:transcriptional regulator with XRE-family HTH domain
LIRNHSTQVGREVHVLAAEQDKSLGNRRRLAVELRRLRDRAGLSGRQLAERIGVSQSKVSRIESGLTIPNGPEVAAWAAAVSASGTAAELLTMLSDAVYTEVHPWHAALQEQVHLQDEIQEIENRVGVELTYEPTVVPGLLQTAEYARRLFTMFEPAYAPIDIPAVVAGRLDRQAALFDPARRFSFLVTEAALRWRVGPTHVLFSQLDRIASLSTLDNVSIGLIPHSAPARTHSPHGFVIFEPIDHDGDALVMVETVHANVTVNDPLHIALYRRQWSLLGETAAFGDAARELLAVIAADIRLLSPEGNP